MTVLIKIVQQDQECKFEQEIKRTQKITIGRGSKADIRIKDEGLSSVHGRFKLEENGKLLYEDLNSKNGSFLNGQAVYASHVMIEDSLKIGSVEIYVDFDSLSISERYGLGRRVTKSKRQKDVTLVKKKV